MAGSRIGVVPSHDDETTRNYYSSRVDRRAVEQPETKTCTLLEVVVVGNDSSVMVGCAKPTTQVVSCRFEKTIFHRQIRSYHVPPKKEQNGKVGGIHVPFIQ